MARSGKHRQEGQQEMPFFVAFGSAPYEAAEEDVQRMSAAAAMRCAVQRCDLDQFEVADKIPISHGYMSKVLKGTAGLHGPKLVKFMSVTESVAPLQWLAQQMGCEVVIRDKRAAERAALLARLAELEEKAA